METRKYNYKDAKQSSGEARGRVGAVVLVRIEQWRWDSVDYLKLIITGGRALFAWVEGGVKLSIPSGDVGDLKDWPSIAKGECLMFAVEMNGENGGECWVNLFADCYVKDADAA